MKKLITISLMLAGCLSLLPAAASAQEIKNPYAPWNRRKVLERDNKKKDAVIDSLMKVIEQYESDKEESVGGELERIYAHEGLGAGIAPEDYSAEVTDSLLDIWYLHKMAGGNGEGDYDMDAVHFESNVSDKVFIQRLADMNSYISLPYNETVRNYIILYSEKMPTKMAQMLGLAQYYFPIFEETFNRYGLPEELKYMAVIESALNPVARSRAGASGIWQFMYNTAKVYGLEINSYVDERLDVEKAADAAARYLRDSYGLFGDWSLAISSYNCGAGNVNKAIRRSGSRDFWKIYDYLPRETRGYVPAFVGAMYAFRYYKEHGIVPTKCSLPAHVDTIKVNKMLHFKQISEVAKIPEEELKTLNPQYLHEIIPGKDKEYILKLPYNRTADFVANEDSIYKYKAAELFNPVVLENIKETGSTSTDRIVYKVKKGDYLGKIAAKYNVKVNDIKKWNKLKSNNLSIGQRLVIYRKGVAPKPVAPTVKEEPAKPAPQTAAVPDSSKAAGADSLKDSASAGLTKAEQVEAVAAETKTADSAKAAETKTADAAKAAAPEYTIYTVKKGDTLYHIAQKYSGVSVDDIKKLNGVDSNIRPGMKLKIPKK